nr:MAG TPA: hypothetical protein [Caudoviricetes sp.]
MRSVGMGAMPDNGEDKKLLAEIAELKAENAELKQEIAELKVKRSARKGKVEEDPVAE